ncbi:PH domain-containing protein [Streptomyces spinoverrucosus]|uniref:PH domain-containing protein n=1 Tax=Streptomyces spinoverrucosus TaxID=284043 RepID=UPI0018C43389|nr:PH domain-containing protein [Streptomyces spinoverrucosus]MBG0852940.1 PH domain-containing protein [Streptomyces spinoverrucosus]
MTTPDQQSPAPQPPRPTTRDRIYRSHMGLVGGALLLGLAAWIGGDAILMGGGRAPWLALATLLLVVPLVVAFTLRPAVYAGEDGLRIRNPFRLIVLPWGEVAALRSGYTNEVVTKAGAKYQLWAIPVSLRARSRAARKEARRVAAGEEKGRAFGGSARADVPDGPVRADSDRIMDDLREIQEAREQVRTAQGEVTVRWAYEIAGPAVAGAVLLAVLLAVG